MAETAIEWTERTWNPIVGCSIVSPGCTNCYAMKMADRLEHMGPQLNGDGNPHLSHYMGTTTRGQFLSKPPVWTGKLAIAPDSIVLEPLRRRKPTIWFVNSMGDLFHEAVPDAWIDRVFAVMALAPQHTFQVLTKRAARMRAYVSALETPRRVYDIVCDLSLEQAATAILLARPEHAAHAPPGRHVLLGQWPLRNVWKGTSAEDQRRADERIPDLLATPAAVRFVSAEPLLGGVRFDRISFAPSLGDMVTAGMLNALTGTVASYPITTMQGRGFLNRREFNAKLDWIIVGGESGQGARPMHPDWPRHIRDQCAAAGTAFFFKQWGEWRPNDVRGVSVERMAWVRDDGLVKPWSHSLGIDAPQAEKDRWRAAGRAGKKAAGRLLDDVEHNAMPEVAR